MADNSEVTTSSTEEVRQMYDGSADSYDKMMDAEMGLPIYADTLSRLAERVANLEGAVVDTSCGSGHMLELYHRYDADRSLGGVDLSSRMTQIAAARLEDVAEVSTGDMRDLGRLSAAAAVVSFFALHHLSPDEVQVAFGEWHRVLQPGGQLVVAAWEGTGPIDYGEQFNITALLHSREQLEDWTRAAGFVIDRCVVEPVEEMGMDAIYLEATKSATE